MREIKFRAWVKDSPDKELYKDNTMYDWDTVADDCNWFIKLDNDFWESVGGDAPFELMQYTGLKDKNGKEIYEGDVVNVCAFTDTPHKIVFDRGAFCIIGISSDLDADIKYAQDERSEIIGNIWESPELLK